MLIAVFDCFSDIKWEGVGDVGGGRYNLSLSLSDCIPLRGHRGVVGLHGIKYGPTVLIVTLALR